MVSRKDGWKLKNTKKNRRQKGNNAYILCRLCERHKNICQPFGTIRKKMKKHLSIIMLLFLIHQSGLCQINLDALKIEFEKIYIQERSGNDWNAYTIKYLNKDSLVRFVIPFNRKDEIEESIWGIALSEYKYDEKEREIERRYYNRLVHQ